MDDVHTGLVRLRNDINKHQRTELAEGLSKLGFELLDDAKSKTVEQIKNSIIQKIHHSDYLDIKVNWSALLSDELHQITST
ncbi:hypothetical protein [Mucilaginibacter humi]|uniref:hypothetical protein n=1 Tax=Mucilaginibacter humi TaxID=2732510 RepID=UPI00293B89B3|nr:hypothetical protein [Mucilaginibacter humi]